MATLLESLASKDVPYTMPDTCDLEQLFSVNHRLPYKPTVAIQPRTIQHISDAVACAAEHGIKVQVYGGGHSYAAFCLGGRDGAMVIYMREFCKVELGEDGIAIVGAGCRLGPLARALWDQDKRAIAHGNCSSVGVAGHALHGGFGHFSRAWGLALDHIVAVDVVRASGAFVRADCHNNSELYYAMRGAGDSFGVAVHIYFQTRPAPDSTLHFEYHLNASVPRSSDAASAPDITAAIARTADAMIHIERFVQSESIVDRNLGIGIILGPLNASKDCAPPNSSLTHELPGAFLPFSIRINGTYLGTVDDFSVSIAPELQRGLPKPLRKSVLKPYPDYLKALEDLHGDDLESIRPEKHNFFAKSVATPAAGLSKAAWIRYFEYICSMQACFPCGWFSMIDLHGGADSQICVKDVNFAAYNVRNHLWVAQHYAYTDIGHKFPDEGFHFVEGLNQAMTEHIPDHDGAQAYINYVDSSLNAAEAHDVYYGKDLYQRLKAAKEKLDPENVFANPHSI